MTWPLALRHGVWAGQRPPAFGTRIESGQSLLFVDGSGPVDGLHSLNEGTHRAFAGSGAA